MKLKNITKSKGMWAALVVCVVLIGLMIFIIGKIGKDRKADKFKPPKVSATQNPSPLNPTTSPNAAVAQQAEVEWLKKHGKYFRWEDEKIDGKPPKPKVVEPERIKAAQVKRARTEKDMIRETFWASYKDLQNPRGVTITMASAEPAAQVVTPFSPTDAWRYGCPVSGVVMRSTYATTKGENLIMVKITDPANPAGIPAGTIVTGTVVADYSTFRAVATMTSVSLPSGAYYPVNGTVLGPDGLPGLGHKVVRNDRKAIGLGALFAGMGVGAEEARSDSTETSTTDYSQTQTETKNPDRLEEGILAGAGEALTTIADGIVDEYKQISPVVVTIPQGFPVEVVFFQKETAKTAAQVPAESETKQPQEPLEG